MCLPTARTVCLLCVPKEAMCALQTQTPKSRWLRQSLICTCVSSLQIFPEILPDYLVCAQYYNGLSIEITEALVGTPAFCSHARDLCCQLYLMPVPLALFRTGSEELTYKALFLHLLQKRQLLAMGLLRTMGVPLFLMRADLRRAGLANEGMVRLGGCVTSAQLTRQIPIQQRVSMIDEAGLVSATVCFTIRAPPSDPSASQASFTWERRTTMAPRPPRPK